MGLCASKQQRALAAPLREEQQRADAAAAKPGSVRIFIAMLDGSQLPLHVEPSTESVADLKLRIHSALSIPSYQQTLTFSGQPMPNALLSDQKLVADSVIHLIINTGLPFEPNYGGLWVKVVGASIANGDDVKVGFFALKEAMEVVMSDPLRIQGLTYEKSDDGRLSSGEKVHMYIKSKGISPHHVDYTHGQNWCFYLRPGLQPPAKDGFGTPRTVLKESILTRRVQSPLCASMPAV